MTPDRFHCPRVEVSRARGVCVAAAVRVAKVIRLCDLKLLENLIKNELGKDAHLR